jgi:hypothetical protein
MKLLSLAICLATLAACVGPRERGLERGPAAPLLSKQWLAGGWVLEGEACESDAGIIYRSDGSWIADGAAGRWKIDNSRLVTVIAEEEDNVGTMVRLDPPLRKVEEIASAEANTIQIRGENGDIRRLKRCAVG